MVAFDWRAPRLAQTDMDEINKARQVQQLCINDALLRVLHRGKPGAAVAEMMATKLLSTLEAVVPKVPTVLQLACSELVVVAKALLLLTGNSSYDVKILAQIPSSCDVLKQLLGQTPFWREAEKKVREAAVARELYLPEIRSTMESLRQATLCVARRAGARSS